MSEGCDGCLDEFLDKSYFPCSQCDRNPNGFIDYYEVQDEPDNTDDEEDGLV